MPEVSIKIGPRSYNIGCGDGEQNKVAELGALIAEKYEALGTARAPTESQNLVFAALFMADELAELRKRVSKAEKTAATAQAQIDEALKKAEDTAQTARDEAERKIEKAKAKADQEKEKSGGKKAELKAEIETLRKAEARSRDQVQRLKSELSDLREANSHQHDLFGNAEDPSAVAEALELLAIKSEKAAEAMEAAAK
ncbi:MAG: cell division protein ZapA [Pseudomonadota bacterium]|nr:cell division protein ZapA [Pseudomonadota bacterium]